MVDKNLKPRVTHKKDAEDFHSKVIQPILTDDREALLKNLYALPDGEILDRILEMDRSRELIQNLPSEDFFWLVKKIGEDDCLPLLKLATEDQWQYVLDLEIWRKDRLDLAYTSIWMKRLQQADCSRLVKWLFSEGQAIAYYHFLRSVEVIVINTKDDAYDIPDGFFSLDGVFYIRVIDSEHRETIENIIRVMAAEDLNRYQTLFLSLAGVLPAEMEEDMYRLRNVRLAEHGFLPFEEALSVYAPLDPDTIRIDKKPELSDLLFDNENRAITPVSPLYHVDSKNLLTEATSRIMDPLFLDRIRLEFAGLCNQILSAEGLPGQELDILIRTCRKAAGILNLAIERRCGTDISSAEDLLRNHSLLSLFQVGFGFVLKVKWEAERWFKQSWFNRHGFGTDFWGEQWGSILTGLLAKIPRYYAGSLEREEYRDFEGLSDLGECLKVLRGLMVLDSLLERLVEFYQIDENMIHSSETAFRPLLFNLWGRQLLKIEPSFSGLSLEQAKNLFSQLRAGKREAPYKMSGFKETFIRDFIAYASNFEPEAASILENILSLIWQEFYKEYEWVSIDDLDGRYSKFVTILDLKAKEKVKGL